MVVAQNQSQKIRTDFQRRLSKLIEIPYIAYFAFPFLLGHIIGYSWLTYQRRKRDRISEQQNYTGVKQ